MNGKSYAHGKDLIIGKLLGRMINKPFATAVVVLLGFVSSLLLSFFVYLQFKSIESLKINRLGAVLINALSPRMNLFGFSTMLFLAIMAAFMFAITFNKNLPYFKLLNMLGWKWQRINSGILFNFMSSYALGYALALIFLVVYALSGRTEGAKYFDFLRPFLSASAIALFLMVLAAGATVFILLIKSKVLGRKTISVGLRNSILVSLAIIVLSLAAWQISKYIQSHRLEKIDLETHLPEPTATPQENTYSTNLVHYDLQLRFEPTNDLLSGKVWINFTNRFNAALDNLVFRLYPNAEWALATPSDSPYLVVNWVKADGEIVHTEMSNSNSVLNVLLGKTLVPDQKISLEIDYTLRLGLVESKEGGWWSSKAFYPLLAVYDQKGWRTDNCSYCEQIIFSDQGSYHLSLTHPQDMQILSNANQTSIKMEEDGYVTDVFDSILLRELFIGMSKEFTMASEGGEGFRIQVATLNDQTTADKLVERAKVVLAFYSEEFGRYPFDTFTLLASPSSGSGGLSFSGGAELFYKVGLSDLDPALAELTAAQWWSEAVGVDFFQAPWQSETLNVFSSWLYLRSLPDQTQFETAKNKAGEHVVSMPLNCVLKNDISAGGVCFTLVRNNGPLAWLKMEDAVTKENLLDVLKEYYKSCQGKICSPETLLKIIKTRASYDFSTLIK
jgi:hypothetical protein